MKAMMIKDIMLGDWVYILNFPEAGKKTPVKIVGIDTNHNAVEYVHNGIRLWSAVVRLEPIPLTLEILEKNGFVYDDTPLEQFWKQFGLSIGGTIGHYWIVCGVNVSIDVSYVHRLQAVLKLCKIDKEIEL